MPLERYLARVRQRARHVGGVATRSPLLDVESTTEVVRPVGGQLATLQEEPDKHRVGLFKHPLSSTLSIAHRQKNRAIEVGEQPEGFSNVAQISDIIKWFLGM